MEAFCDSGELSLELSGQVFFSVSVWLLRILGWGYGGVCLLKGGCVLGENVVLYLRQGVSSISGMKSGELLELRVDV